MMITFEIISNYKSDYILFLCLFVMSIWDGWALKIITPKIVNDYE